MTLAVASQTAARSPNSVRAQQQVETRMKALRELTSTTRMNRCRANSIPLREMLHAGFNMIVCEHGVALLSALKANAIAGNGTIPHMAAETLGCAMGWGHRRSGEW